MGLALGLFFDYLPHRPFQERDRWLNARVYPNPILNLLIGGQNYHLVHHLWPTVPWYRYEAAYYQMKPLLDQKGCHQSLGLLQSPKDFFGFLYDILLGIRFHRADSPMEETEKPLLEVVKPTLDLTQSNLKSQASSEVEKVLTNTASEE